MLSSQPVMPTAQSFLPRYASPPAGSDEAEWRAASDGFAATLLRYATALAAVSAVAIGLIATSGTALITNDETLRAAVRPLAAPLAASVLLTGFVGASEGVLLARREIPFLASVYLATSVLLPPALLAVKRRGGPVALVWTAFGVYQGFRAALFTARIWGPRLLRKTKEEEEEKTKAS